MRADLLSGVIAPTTRYEPVDEDGSFDEASFRRYLRWLSDNDVDALYVEDVFDYADAHRERVTRILTEVADDVPMIMGASAWDTKTAVQRAKNAQAAGIDAVFMTGPPKEAPLGEKSIEDPGSESIVDHYRHIDAAVDIPICLYNTPSAAPGIMEPDTIAEIVAATEHVQYMKAGSRTFSNYKRTANGLVDSDLEIIAGKSYYNFHQLASVWGTPAAPVGLLGYLPSLLPAEHVEMWEAFQDNDIDRARTVWNEKILPLADLLYNRAFGYNEKLAPMEVLKQLGIYETSNVPRTTADIDDHMKHEISKILERIDPDTPR
jgi:4-hydroxy-tetrahydrodipicolinate synthase